MLSKVGASLALVLAVGLLVDVADGRKGFGPGEQEWAFTNVRPGAHMFWWLYYTSAEVSGGPEDRPLVMWLQGGPGASSTGFGNFKEIGPLDEDLQPRNFTWVKDCNVLFVDNPVGTGFSYVDGGGSLAHDNRQIAEDLVEVVRDVFERVPRLRSAPFYVAAESYGGKMAAEFALLLHRQISAGNLNVNLRGVALGDSWISPIDSVLTWAPYLLNLGVVDDDGYAAIDQAAQETRSALDAGQFTLATTLWSRTEQVVLTVSDGVDFYDVMKRVEYWEKDGRRRLSSLPKPGRDVDKDISHIMNVQVKEALGLPSNVHWTESSGSVFQALAGDFMKPVTDVVESLLNETDIRVAVISGQKDLIVDTPGTVHWVQRLRWDGSAGWQSAGRKPLVVNGYVEGYSKRSGPFYMYWVNRAGHMVPLDNPPAMDAVLRDLTDNYSGAK